MSGLGSFLSSFFPTTHADSEEEEQKPAASEQASANEEAPEEAPKEAEAEEEEEPEDEHPKIRADCEASPACAPMKHHFEKCQEKVNAGEGYKGEDCVDEIMMHCSEACAAPKVFSKLR
ncbi:Non-heme 11 kDa protein of cytochrome bc1 complex [Mycena albidolilacea]|uniref:Non-heme 11 kDa protein of cytochrome bc1 complex n=1 Tax=Mycena albidolilacea TaxID=1033008 RepID=A0AAD6Z4V7_9AGAR|nr:Non-heme 11 kDa protein of cytochrome bc1 complex [Mycena albidolilacea]